MWLKNKSCLASPIGLCVKTHPLQITKIELNKLKNYFNKFININWPLNSLYFYGLRNKYITFSLSTFYKYAKLSGFFKNTPKNRHKNHCAGLRAEKINQYWHADVTIFKPVDNTKIYIYLIIDNFSRYILSWRASLELSAKIRFETITEAYQNFITNNDKETINIIVDGGPENSLIPLHPIDELSVKKIIAQQDIIFSNSMIEALNKQIKYRYLFQKELLDFNATVEHLKKSIPDFNDNRPYAPLHGLTPAEVYIGRLKPDKNMFKERIESAKQERYIENTSNPCPMCSD